MPRRLWTFSAVAALATSLGSADVSLAAQQGDEHHVVPLKKFPLDQRFETVSGDPSKSGVPYVIRIHSEPGFVVMPHTHQVDENIVVVKGSWALGMGGRFNRPALDLMEVGTYAFVPKRVAHFAWSKTDAIIQVHGIGPFITEWVTPLYALTDHGVLLETSAMRPGRPVTSSPPGCFDLKLGSQVTGSYGTGVVVGAVCTPGQLTQYRVQRSDGERFWGLRQDLKWP